MAALYAGPCLPSGGWGPNNWDPRRGRGVKTVPNLERPTMEVGPRDRAGVSTPVCSGFFSHPVSPGVGSGLRQGMWSVLP